MKRFLLFITAVLICGVAFAQTIRWHVGDTVITTTTCESGNSITPPTAPYKYGYHFKEWETLYTQIEYLESTGTQWITFGEFYPDRNYKSVVDSLGCAFGVNYSYWMGPIVSSTWRAEGDMSTAIQGSIRQKNLQFYYTPNLTNQTAYYILSNTTNEYTSSWPINNITTGWGFGICGLTNDSSNHFITRGKVYSVFVFEDDILIHELIPVLDKNGTPCMYDKVTGQFFYNAGTGQFIAGPVI